MSVSVPRDSNSAPYGITSLVKAVYRQVWDEFYASEAIRAQQGLADLPCTRPDSPVRDFGLNIADEDPLPVQPSETHPNEEDNIIFQVSWLHTGEHVSSRLYRLEQDLTDEVFEEHPEYESCQPTPANILHGDDSNDVPFIPYADDQSFCHKAYMDEHKGVSWQRPEMASQHGTWIAVETGRRLVEIYGLDLAAVDATGILPLPLLSTSDNWGAIIRSQNMDCPTAVFREQASGYQRLLDVSPPNADDLKMRVQNGLSVFCASLNCIQAYCITHNSENHRFDADDRYVAYADHYLPPSQGPCGDSCYLSTTAADQSQKRKRLGMKLQDIHNVELLFRISPEATSCEIAELMQLRCYEVYSQRIDYHTSARRNVKPKDAVQPVVPIALSDGLSKIPQRNTLKYFQPCSHAGMCGATVEDCTCCQKDMYCERNCCCTSDCSRRFPGCNCASLRQKTMRQQYFAYDPCELEPELCFADECPCVMNGRECDPELCDCLHSSSPDDEINCRNDDLRRACGKRLRVSPGFSGLGVFLEEPASRGDLICEYVGELIYDATTETRDLIAQHRGRAYVYKLNDTFDVDASHAGNVARFINHAPGKQANCVTMLKNVSGDHRIGIYARKSLRSGTELTIDYGAEFFKANDRAASSSSSGAVSPIPEGSKSRSRSRT